MQRTAGNVLSEARRGIDLVAERSTNKAAMVGDLIPRFLAFKNGKISDEYHYQLTLFLTRYWQPFHEIELIALKRAEIAKRLDELKRLRYVNEASNDFTFVGMVNSDRFEFGV